MSRVHDAIARTGGRALVGYLPVGFPDLDTSIEATVALAEGGCTVIELGIPYSDPGLDGPVVQRATQETLDRGFRMSEVFEALEAITARTDVPVVPMTYWNPVLHRGVDEFAAALRAAGGAGLITPDLTPENAAAWIAASDAHDLDRIFLAAPSSSDTRLDRALTDSRGFVYTVSTMGTTGTREAVDTAARTLSDRLSARRDALGIDLPRCVGLGISTGAHVRSVLEFAEGAIVGSALVEALRRGGVQGVRDTVGELVTGTLDQSE